MVNYQNGKIYKIVNDVNDDIYIGSTCNPLWSRFACHKSYTKLEQQKNRKLYKTMLEIGVEHFKIILIEVFKCDTKDELRAREDFFIRTIKPSLNSANAVRTKEDVREYKKEYQNLNKERLSEENKQYYIENKETFSEKRAEYYEKNKEKISASGAIYRENNKEIISERKKVYANNNRVKIAEYSKTWREEHPDSRKARVLCECCQENVIKDSIRRHEKTQKHMKNLLEFQE